MNLEEFRSKAKEIRDNAEKDVRQLGKELAFSNATAKAGDLIKSKHGQKAIIVDDIKFSMTNYMVREETPECVYFGFVLTKSGRPRKDNERTMIYESEILKDSLDG